MIKAEQIPDEVVEAAVKAEYEHHFRHSCKKWPEDCYEKEREGWRINQRLAIAAAINAWPRMEIHTDGTEDWIELTLTQEPST